MILYLIQAHRDVEQVMDLLENISRRNNACLLNLDPCLKDRLEEINAQVAAREFANVFVRIGTPIAWGGISQVHAFLDAISFALSLDVSWDFLVNLSADSIALAPQPDIEAFYRQARRSGQRVHLSFFGPGVALSGFELLPWGQASGFDIDGEDIQLYRRVPVLIDREVRKLLDDRSTNPLFRWRRRCAVHVSDLILEKKLVIRPLLPYEADYRLKSFNGRLLFGGRAWFTLDRSAVEDMMSDPLLGEFVHHLEHFFCPDELILQTYFSNTDRFKPEEVARENQRFRRGDIVKIADSLLEELFDSSAFFARKIVLRKCPAIRARLNELIR